MTINLNDKYHFSKLIFLIALESSLHTLLNHTIQDMVMIGAMYSGISWRQRKIQLIHINSFEVALIWRINRFYFLLMIPDAIMLKNCITIVAITAIRRSISE